jgi:magnesium-transporting ATPase (P-type)
MSLIKGQEEKIESSLLTYMHDMKVLGTIGLQDIFNVRDTLVVKDIIRNGIKVWMLSSDDEIQMVVNCNSMNLMDKDSNPLIINGESERETEEQVKKCLNSILDEDANIDREEFDYSTFTIKLNSNNSQ